MACAICGNDTSNRTYTVREMMFGLRDEFEYLECSSCGCLQLQNAPTDMARYYPAGYYSFTHSPLALFNTPKRRLTAALRYSYAVTNRNVIGKVLYQRFPETLARTLLPAHLAKRSRIVDVGSGSGLLLYGLRNAGFEQTLGIDPFLDETIVYDNGLKILKQSIHELQGEWDLVMMHHSFEHVPDPLETMQTIARLLAPGGVALIRIPVASSYAWEQYRTNWVQLDAPRHYFLHTAASIQALCDRAGLHVDDVIYDSWALQFWGSEQYINDIPLVSERSYRDHPDQSMFSAAQIAAFDERAAELNAAGRGDQAAFYIRH